LTDSSSANVHKWVGDSTIDVFTFAYPTSNRAWCTLETTEVVKTDNSAWTGTVRLTGHTNSAGAGAQPFQKFNINSLIAEEVLQFVVKSTFTNNQIKYSPISTITVECGSTYTITQPTAPTNPQRVAHLSADGFVLPTYVTQSYDAACPVQQWKTTSSSNSLVAHSQLNDPVLVSSSQVVKPTNNALHLQYQFYVQLTARGGSIGY
jgi:hypothetical protein